MVVSPAKAAKLQAPGRNRFARAVGFDFAIKAGGVYGAVCIVKRSKDGQPVRYLVVDDSVFARKNLARMVETFGGQVAGEAGDGMTAITEYDRTNPDIVLMDITMPQMEGIEAAEKIVPSILKRASSWSLRWATRKTSWPPYSGEHATLCRNRSSRKFYTK